MKSEWTLAQVDAQNAKVFNSRFGQKRLVSKSKDTVEIEKDRFVPWCCLCHSLGHFPNECPTLASNDKKPMKTRSKSGYNKEVVLAYFKECGLPEPEFEFYFAKDIGRKWRFDIAFTSMQFPLPSLDGKSKDTMTFNPKVAVEADGGIFCNGGHNRGAQIKATWEKENEANIRGWKLIKCEPKEVCSKEVADLIKRALGITS